MQAAASWRAMGGADGNTAEDVLRVGRKVCVRVGSNTFRGHGFDWLEYRLVRMTV